MKGSGAAGVATLGAAGVEIAQQVLAEIRSAVLPLVPYLDALRWVFIAVALAGIAVTIYPSGPDPGGDRLLIPPRADFPRDQRWRRSAT
jgi:hypothetical protein